MFKTMSQYKNLGNLVIKQHFCNYISNLFQSYCSELPGLSSESMIRHTIPLVKWSTADPLDLIGSFLVAYTNGLIPNTVSWTGWRQADEKHHFRHLNRSQKKTSVFPIAVRVAVMVGAHWGIHDRVAHDKQFLLLPRGDLCLLTLQCQVTDLSQHVLPPTEMDTHFLHSPNIVVLREPDHRKSHLKGPFLGKEARLQLEGLIFKKGVWNQD